MFSRSKGEKGKKIQAQRPNNLAQFGLLDIPIMGQTEEMPDENEGNDEDLEAELMALMNDETSQYKHPNAAKKRIRQEPLDQMVTKCLNDNDDAEMDHFDEDDPELLAELSALTAENPEDVETDDSVAAPPPVAANAPVIVRPSPLVAGQSVLSLLKERISMYQEAERNALAAHETSRAKRFTRGLKTLNQMLAAIEKGKPIKEDEIPPAVLLSSRNNSASDLSIQSSNSAINILNHNSNDSFNQSRFGATEESTPTIPNKPNFAQLPSISQDSSGAIGSERNETAADEGRQRSARPAPSPPTSPYSTHPSATPSTIQHDVVFKKNDPQSGNLLLDRNFLVPSPRDVVEKRQQEYKMAALRAKKAGDRDEAVRLMRIAKQLDPILQAAADNQNIDLESLPPKPPEENFVPVDNVAKPKAESQLERSQDSSIAEPLQPPANAPPQSAPASVSEALEQRLLKYTEQRDKAKAEGNARKERMNQRIIKQYQDCLRAVKMGRTYDFSELPTPPGFPPLPVSGPTLPSADLQTPPESGAKPEDDPSPRLDSGGSQQPTNSQGGQPGSNPSQNNQQSKVASSSSGNASSAPQKNNVRKAPQSRVERQLSVLTRRQGEFRTAALEAKRRGEIEQAKEFLRNAKGIEQLVQATNSGLPVDMNTVPIPPQEKAATASTSLDFEVVDREDCVYSPPDADADAAVIYSKLEHDLISQIKMCAQTREHFKAIGDVASSNRFEQMILNTKKDLDAVRVAFKRGDTPPRFHYENRTFTMIRCNTELNDSDCEVSVVRGVNFNVTDPAECDSYVKVEFPYPAETPPQQKTPVVKGSNNPEYNHKVLFSIDRKLRATQRVFKRQVVKMQVVTKGGWFHRDSVLGSVKVPLAELENKCTFHQSFDLTDERKKMVGGKLEVKIRVRNPILSKQLDKVTEKWIVIDGF